MKRSTKTLVTIGLAFVLLGAVLMGLGLWRGDGLGGVSNVTHREQREVVAAEQISVLEIEADNDEVVLLPSEDGQVTVTFDAIYNANTLVTNYDITLLDGKLTIRQTSQDGVFFSIDFSLDRQPLTVRLPADCLSQLEVRSDNGTVEVEGLTVSGDAALFSENGKLELEHMQVEGELSLETRNGNIELEDVRVNGSLRAQNHNGRTTLKSLTVSGTSTLDAQNGSVSLESCTMRDTLRAELRNGKLDAKRTALAACEIESNNGAVTLSLLGDAEDYYLDLASDNGTIHAPQGNRFAEQTLSIQSDNGSITVKFEK